MIGNRWFCEPDDERESWCFLVLNRGNPESSSITGWHVGYGNPKKTTRTLSSSPSSEEEIIRELLEEIYHCRREGILVITVKRETMPALRSRVLLLGLEGVSLRGVKHVCIEELLDEYFLDLGGPDSFNISGLSGLGERIGVKTDGLGETEMAREVFLRIGPLLPEGRQPKVVS